MVQDLSSLLPFFILATFLGVGVQWVRWDIQSAARRSMLFNPEKFASLSAEQIDPVSFAIYLVKMHGGEMRVPFQWWTALEEGDRLRWRVDPLTHEYIFTTR